MGVKPALERKKHVHANVGNHAANQKSPRKQFISQFRRVIATCEMTFTQVINAKYFNEAPEAIKF